MPHSALIHSLPPLGFIAVDVHFHRPPGDPFNALTWPFPLIKEQAEGSKLGQIVTKDSYPEGFLDRFVEAGQRLASKGCVGIITSCGFLAMAQPVLASRLPIPVATSALIQIPSIRSFLPPQKSIGVITYDGTRLGPLHLSQLGISAEGIYIVGAPDDGYLRGVIRDGREYVHDEIEAELVRCAKELVEAHSDVGAIVLECTQMPPFAMAIQQAVGLPIHDVYTMGKWFYSGLVRRDEWPT
ncbi:uncharacterized protein PAC_19870 [Phialocephala subalpina]|uniref:Aspartate/glutamate racemase family protein n=1 Tax=Phialocephala subalpina TaxID=576137 RepID=A0A1L7XY84_9HELO|nr:uncharacterized protein PAC_19870 [Phialocephala subalpina]